MPILTITTITHHHLVVMGTVTIIPIINLLGAIEAVTILQVTMIVIILMDKVTTVGIGKK